MKLTGERASCIWSPALSLSSVQVDISDVLVAKSSLFSLS